MDRSSEWCLVASSREKQDKEAAGAVIGDPRDGSRVGGAGQDVSTYGGDEVSQLLWDSGPVRHRQCLELRGEQGHQALQGALLGTGAQGLVLSVPEELQRQRQPWRGQKVLQAGGGEEAQGRSIVLLLNM